MSNTEQDMTFNVTICEEDKPTIRKFFNLRAVMRNTEIRKFFNLRAVMRNTDLSSLLGSHSVTSSEMFELFFNWFSTSKSDNVESNKTFRMSPRMIMLSEILLNPFNMTDYSNTIGITGSEKSFLEKLYNELASAVDTTETV